MGFAIAAIVLVGLVFLVISIITLANGTSLVLNYAGVQDWAPDWIANGGVVAWIVTLIVLLIVAAVIRVVVSIVRAVVLMLVGLIGGAAGAAVTRGPEGGAAGGGIAVILGAIITYGIGVAVALTLTSSLLAFGAANPEFTSYFVSGNWIAAIGTFLFFLGLTAPSSSNSNQDS